MKKASIIILAILAAIGAISFHFLNGSYIGRQLTEIAAQSGSRLIFHSTPRFSLWPPRLSFASLSWQGQIRSLEVNLTAAGGSLRPNLLTFLAGRGTLTEIILDRAAITLRPSTASVASSSAIAGLPEIERLVIRDGIVQIRKLKLANMRLTATSITSRNEADAQCDFILLANGTQLGNVALKSKLHYYSPNITFREGRAAFTAASGDYNPLQAQFSGSLGLPQGTENFPDLNFNIELGEFRYHGILFEDTAFRLTGSAGDYELKDFSCTTGQGNVYANARANFKSGQLQLDATGNSLRLGEILAEAGVAGFEMGNTDFGLQLAATGASQEAIRKSLSGSGTLTCKNLRLAPFGEIALLLPLLGNMGKLTPPAIEQLKIGYMARNGNILIKPVNLSAPGIRTSGEITLDLDSTALSGLIRFEAGDLKIPLELGGRIDDIKWRIGKP